MTIKLLHGDCRDAILIDLDERTRPMALERIVAGAPLFASVVMAV